LTGSKPGSASGPIDFSQSFSDSIHLKPSLNWARAQWLIVKCVSEWTKSMSESAALNKTRIAARIALASLLGAWLAGCSSDSTRLSESPFANPFATASNDEGGAAPYANVSSNGSSQHGANYAAAAHPSPVAVSSLPPPAPATTGAIGKPTTTQPITGFGSGWRAAGGSPVVVADGENLDTISRRYGVPSSALLKANGFTSPSQVHGGVRLIVPVYDAAGKSASVDAQESPELKVSAGAQAHDKVKEAKLDSKDSKSKAKDKAKDKKPADIAAAKTKPAPGAKPNVAETAVKPTTVAKAEIATPSTSSKKKTVDSSPTGAVNAQEPGPSPALTGAQADAAGVAPEFRWPARGRIIQGFKAGGNDGINIAVPEGTSVKAAESGVVAYAGSELKGYGNLILIRHPNGFVSAYANNGELDVKRGESVKRGQIIAKSGQSGNVSSPQLHFELRKGSTPVDPTSFLAGL
jgi:murein DD-endopeptidase MepM/ murein hydrolase activator NlpD